jgi:hypothetical protein
MPPCQNFGFFQLRMSAPFRKISKFQGKTALHYALESQSLNARNVFLEEKEIDVNTGLKDYTAMYRWSDSFTTPEPHPGYGSTMLVVPTSSSKEFPVSYSDAWKRWSLTPET